MTAEPEEECSTCRRHRAPDKLTHQSQKADATAVAIAIVAKLWERLYLSVAAAVLTVKGYLSPRTVG